MRTVFFDVDTQLDFMLPAGALYVPGAEGIVPAVARLNRWAAGHSIPVVSDTDAHAENDPEFSRWPPHCVAGTAGQRKIAETLLERRVTLPARLADYSIQGAQQIILEKTTLDCFDNPNLPGLLDRLDAGRAVVYGVVTEYCVRLAALGLLRVGMNVELVTDAVMALADEDAARTLDEIQRAGGRLTTVERVCAD